MVVSRRRLLAGMALAGTVGAAGCLGDEESPATDTPTPTPSNGNGGTPTEGDFIVRQLFDRSEYTCEDPPEPEGDAAFPLRSEGLPLPSCPDELNSKMVSGGVGKDGIPSIDDPVFEDAAAADERLEENDPVFGVEMHGVAKAYPQIVLVWHEIVNDTIDGDPVSVTYCPLTGTVQGFPRGDSEFGVSGRLLNSNLIMYDRETDSWFPQMLATAITGSLTGATLEEFPVTWTTWGRWREAYPDTEVLTDDTGYVRQYGVDPYGTYNPSGGYYSGSSLLFGAYVNDPEGLLHPKAVVIGARSNDGALAVEKELLRSERVIDVDVGSVQHVAVYDEVLDTGYIYRNPDGESIERVSEGYRVGGETHAADELPLASVIRYDAMWFAWFGYYPWTTVVLST